MPNELIEAQKALSQKDIEAQVKKELRRIKRFVKAAEKRGYTFSDNVIPTMPKKITAGTLRKVQKIKPKTLYKKAVYTTPAGKKIAGTARKKQESIEAAKKSAYTKKAHRVLRTVREMLANWAPDPRWTQPLVNIKEAAKNSVESILEGAINRLGEKQVAYNLEKRAKEVVKLVEDIIYGKSGRKFREGGLEEIQKNKAAFRVCCYDSPVSVEEAMQYGDDEETADELINQDYRYVESIEYT